MLILEHLSLIFPHKTCFTNFSTTVKSGSKISLIGRNGNGKSSLLKIISGNLKPSSGQVILPAHFRVIYIPQILPSSPAEQLSGGEQLFRHLEEAIDQNPDLLLLDEPTNHLDYYHRSQLLELIIAFPGTLIIATHDQQLLEEVSTDFWHLENEKITVFHGSYQNYLRKQLHEKQTLEKELHHLQNAVKQNQQKQIQEQQRAQQSHHQGLKDRVNQRRPRIVAHSLQLKAQETAGKKGSRLQDRRTELQTQIDQIYLPPPIKPRFILKNKSWPVNQNILSIQNGAVAYQDQQPILSHLNLSLSSHERLALQGNNGSGKTTLLKAILNDEKSSQLIKTGNWFTPSRDQIGYLDQHYQILNSKATVFETIHQLLPNWPSPQIREFLADFLFYTDGQVNTLTKDLSDGEKVRLILAIICACPPQLLILDELTNNLDLETKAYLIQTLNLYQGAIIIVSHDENFLNELKIDRYYKTIKGQLIKNDPLN